MGKGKEIKLKKHWAWKKISNGKATKKQLSRGKLDEWCCVYRF